jgi:hypothetical protein
MCLFAWTVDRAHLITDQIDTLKSILSSSSFPLKSTSKFHILAGCEEYINHLKQRKKCLDMELKLRCVSFGGVGSSDLVPAWGACSNDLVLHIRHAR